MRAKKIACCYHPTTVVLIDDDKSFLSLMSLHLGRDTACKTFSNPQEALEFLKNQYQFDSYVSRCVTHSSEDSPLKRNINVDIKPIRDEIYNKNRYGQISVIVVDQVMPGMKGLELCKSLEGTHFKKILLTGKAQDKDVIDAFNQGIIDKYIPKDSSDLNELIKSSIRELQEDYFNELSSIVLNSLSDDKNSLGTCLSDNRFSELFRALCDKYSISEYYLTDTEGSFLLLDADGRPYILAVKNEEGMQSIYEFADFSDQKLAVDMLEKLKNKKMILYLHSDKDLQLEPKDWEERGILYPANKLEGNHEAYYYAYIDGDLSSYDIDPKKIVSYHSYLEEHA